MSAPPNPASGRRACRRPSHRQPSLRFAFGVAAALAAALGASGPAPADTAPDYALVVLAEPAAPPDLAAGGGARDVRLSYHVAEIFRGEPGGVDVVVSHPRLDSEQRRALAGARRVILLANPDPAGGGRFVGPMPLRATAEAVAAFRVWSAPPDVRPERDVTDVIADVADDVFVAPRGEHPPVVDLPPILEDVGDGAPGSPVPAEPVAAELPASPPSVDATPAQRAAPEPVTVFAAAAPLAVVRTPPPPSGVSAPVDEDVGSRDEGLPPAELVPAGKAAAEDVVADRSSPAVASAPSAAPAHPAEVALARVDAGAAGDQAASPHPAEVALARVAEKDRARREALAAAAPPEREAVLAGRLALPGERDRAPLMFQPVFVPRTGPGLPPAPDPTRVLGPPLEERRDLRATRAD